LHMTKKSALALVCVELLFVRGMYPYPQPLLAVQPAPGLAQSPALTPDQLDSLVAPVALYPDPILSQVLVASTYPLEIVEAARWLGTNSTLQGKALADAAAKQKWDASVQGLVVFPDLLKQLNQNITWTSELGNAFLAQQQDVFDAVQRMRQKAQSNGTLTSNNQQTVTTATQGGNNYIEIQPASQDVVYIPQYDPAAVWGAPVYPYPAIYYPTGAAVAAGVIAFGAGIAIGAIAAGGWHGWGWNCGWGNGSVVINNNFINRNNFNRANVGNGNSWVHNPAHRGGVPYNNRAVANRFNLGQSNFTNARPTAGQIQQGLNRAERPGNLPANGLRPGQGNLGQGAAGAMRPGNLGQAGGNAFRPSQNPAGQGNVRPSGGDRIGNRSVGGGMGGGALGGINQGGNRAFSNANRGFASRGGGGFRGGGRRR
jgi:hypothetical protein